MFGGGGGGVLISAKPKKGRWTSLDLAGPALVFL
jgi:hypothetical protein